MAVYKPKMFVIIGRKRNLTLVEMRSVESDMPGLTLRTYDDLVARVRNKIERMTHGGTNVMR